MRTNFSQKKNYRSIILPVVDVPIGFSTNISYCILLHFKRNLHTKFQLFRTYQKSDDWVSEYVSIGKHIL